MNTRHLDRLMSRASVGVMAAFAPKPEAGDTSKVGQPERVEEAAGADDGGGDDLGLSAAEQAQFDAMQAGREPGGKEDIEHAGAAGDDGEGGDADGDGGEPGAGDGDGAPADGAPEPAAGEPGKAPPKTISYGKYQRELQKANKARDDLQARLDGAVAETTKERDARLRLDERTNMLLQAIQQKPAPAAAEPKPDADPEPDAEADPIGNLQWHNKRLAKQVQDLTAGRQQEVQQTQAQTQEQQIYRLFEADLQREAQADPAFADAFVHLRETRYRELGFIYADIDITDPEQCKLLSLEDQDRLSANIRQSFHNEQMLVARQALQQRKSPAKVVKNLAVSRGFAPKPPPAAGAAPPAGGNGNGAAPPAVRPVAPAKPGSVTEQLQAIREGLDSSTSLSDAGGSPGGTVTPERIANMTDDEFLQFYDQMPKGQFDRLMGKPS